MDLFFVVLGLLVLAFPIMAIVALVKSVGLGEQLRRVETRLAALERARVAPAPDVSEQQPPVETSGTVETTEPAAIVSVGGRVKALVARINAIFNQVLETPAVRNAINVSQAAEAVGGPASQFDALIKAELKRWPEVAKAAGMKPE